MQLVAKTISANLGPYSNIILCLNTWSTRSNLGPKPISYLQIFTSYCIHILILTRQSTPLSLKPSLFPPIASFISIYVELTITLTHLT